MFTKCVHVFIREDVRVCMRACTGMRNLLDEIIGMSGINGVRAEVDKASDWSILLIVLTIGGVGYHVCILCMQ